MDVEPKVLTYSTSEFGDSTNTDDCQQLFRASVKLEPDDADIRILEEAADLEDPYQCFVCGVDCESQQELISHYEEQHADESSLDYRQCEDVDPLAGDVAPPNIVDVVKKENMEEAFETEEDSTPLNVLVCSVCGFATSGSIDELNRHMLIHVSATSVTCQGCKYLFSEELKDHVRKQPRGMHSCVHCSFKRGDLQEVKDHCITHHAARACRADQVVDTVNSSVKRAIILSPASANDNLIHTTAAPNEGQADVRLTVAADGSWPATDPPLSLTETLKRTTTNVLPNEIVPPPIEQVQWKVVPTPAKQVQRKILPAKQVLRKMVPTVVIKKPPLSPYKPNRVRKHLCPHCNYKARDSYSLKVHVYRHTQEKPFACSLCRYRATQRAHLQKHFKVHIRRGELDFSEVRVSTHSTDL